MAAVASVQASLPVQSVLPLAVPQVVCPVGVWRSMQQVPELLYAAALNPLECP